MFFCAVPRCERISITFPQTTTYHFQFLAIFCLSAIKNYCRLAVRTPTHPCVHTQASHGPTLQYACMQGVFFCLLSFALKLERASLFLCHRFLTFLAQVFTHKSEEGFYRFCSKRQKFCSFARPTLTINATPIPSIAMHISSLLDPFYGQFKFLSTPKYHYSQKFPALSLERVQQ